MPGATLKGMLEACPYNSLFRLWVGSNDPLEDTR